MKRSLSLIPTPAKLALIGGSLKLGRAHLQCDPSLDNPALATLREAWPSDGVATTLVEIARADRLHPQGYQLEVSDAIRLRAASAQGAFYGVQTLLQLLDAQQRTVERVRIDDRPALERRGVHFDLKTQLHRLDYLEGFVRWLAAHKINCILLEYEDKIRYRLHRTVSHPCALTRAAVRRLVQLAARHFIEVIPLQQTLGHLECLGRHPEYAPFMEWSPRELAQGGVSEQLCPSNPRAIRLLEELLGETSDLFDTSPLYHVGGDETRRLGLCLTCRERMWGGPSTGSGPHGPARLYFEHMNRVFALVAKLGKTPVVWCDMFIHFPDILARVPKEVIIADWDYWSTGLEGMNHVAHWRWGAPLTPALARKVPAEELRRWEKYIRARGYPQSFRGFPFQRFFRDRGFRVMGVPAVRRGGDSFHFPFNDEHVPNVIACAQALAGLDANEGMVISSWAVRRSPWENTKFGILAGADAAWTPQQASKPAHDRRFGQQFFGSNRRGYSELCYLVGGRAFAPTQYAAATPRALAGLEREVKRAGRIIAELAPKRNQLAFAHMALARRQSAFDAGLARLLLSARSLWQRPRLMSVQERSSIVRSFGAEAERLWLELRRLRADTRNLYRRTIVAREVESDLKMRYGPAEDILRRIRVLLGPGL